MFIRTCLRYLKHHLLIITEALQKELNEINCPYSNDVNLFVGIIFTIPVHIEIRMSGKINLIKLINFLNSPCEIRKIKAKITLA